MSNSFGDLFIVTIFGDSHGKAIGGVVDGCLPGLTIDEKLIQKELLRRSSAKHFFESPRKEPDNFEILSGIKNGKTTGGPISFIIPNKNQKQEDYENLDNLFRPSHADFTYFTKYGTTESASKLNASGRIFAPVVVAGSIAKQFLATKGISIYAFVKQVGNITINQFSDYDYSLESIEESPVRCPEKHASIKMVELLKQLKEQGNTAGGIIGCAVKGCEPGLGDPVFDKLQAKLAQAMFSIHSVKGFWYGHGDVASELPGIDYNDEFIYRNGKVETVTNSSGGIQGGITNGMDIFFGVAFKPISSLAMLQHTINRNYEPVEFTIKGRHDVCHVPRCVPIVEAMTALVIADSYLKNIRYAKKD
jgi:chorismate synthase